MLRGTCNGEIAISALEEHPCIRTVYSVGLLQRNYAAYYGCYPGGIVLLEWMDLSGPEMWTPSLTAQMGDEIFAIVPVEVKSRISEDSLSSVLICKASSVLCCKADCQDVRVRVPGAQVMQSAHQCFVAGSNIGKYVCCAETGVVFTIVLLYPDGCVEALAGALSRSIAPYVSWTH